MNKITIFVALICAVIVTARDARRARFASEFPAGARAGRGSFDGSNQWSSKLCANQTLAKAFQKEVQQMIATLQGNHSYDRILQKHTQVIAYLKNTTHDAVVTSNCTAYFAGYSNARKLDLKTEEQQAKYEANIQRLFKNILLPLVGARSLFNADF